MSGILHINTIREISNTHIPAILASPDYGPNDVCCVIEYTGHFDNDKISYALYKWFISKGILTYRTLPFYFSSGLNRYNKSKAGVGYTGIVVWLADDASREKFRSLIPPLDYGPPL